MCNRDPGRHAFQELPLGHGIFDLQRRLLHAFESHDGLHVKVFGRQFPARYNFVDRSKCRFHHAARVGEHVRGSGGRPERHVELFIRQVHEIYPRLLNHLARLSRRQDRIDVLITAGAHLRPLALVLLRGARHDGDDVHPGGIHADLFRVICLRNRPEHLLRRLAGGHVIAELREEVFHILYPARAARRYLRQGYVLAVHEFPLQPVEQFVAFFHDGKVGGELGVEYLVEAHASERGDHLLRDKAARGHVEAFADCGAHRGGGLHDDEFLRVFQGFPDAPDVRFLRNSPHRAHGGTLAALDAQHAVERVVEGGGNHRVEPPADEVDGIDALDIAAHRHAPAAENALARIAHKPRRGIVHLRGGMGAFVRYLADAELFSEFLQLAVLVALASVAFEGVI